LLALYETAGQIWPNLGPAAKTGADLWLRSALRPLGPAAFWLPPVCLGGALAIWQFAGRARWRVRPATFVGMTVESVVLAVALVGLSRVLDRLLAGVDSGGALLGAVGAPTGEPLLGGRPLAPLIGFIGAGIYEEAIFRLALIPLLYGVFRLLQASDLPAGTLAVTGASLLFALAHHAGQPAEPFTWYVFLFRWTAGVYFSALFLMRGFGVAVGTHAAYDVLVGWLDWPSA
jgi:hypothetical protein